MRCDWGYYALWLNQRVENTPWQQFLKNSLKYVHAPLGKRKADILMDFYFLYFAC